ncbi:MAG: aquaporin [Parvibaculaceae bacterium]
MAADMARRLVAEGLGTAMLLATVAGSGIMADRLTDDIALTLLGNTLPTGAILVVLISILGPVSGAHFNPAVSLAFALQRKLDVREAIAYAAVQIAGGICGVFLAHAMFDATIVEVSQIARSGIGQYVSEFVATFGLLMTILGGIRVASNAVAYLVGLYITAAYWFTASTSFANPAVTIARSLTDSFSGIRPIDVPAFVAAEIAGAVTALLVMNWLIMRDTPPVSGAESHERDHL